MPGNHSVVAVVVLLVVSGVAVGLVGTGAVDRQSDIVLSPHPENGEYVAIQADDEIEIQFAGSENDNLSDDIDGVNAEAYYRVDEVFNVTNDGSTTARFYVNDSATDVSFYRADDPSDSLEDSDDLTALDPGETAVVGLAIDTRGDTDVDELSSMTIVAEIEAEEEETAPVGGGGGGGASEPVEEETPEPPASITASIQGTDVTVPLDNGVSLSGVGFGSGTNLDTIASVTEVTESPSPEPEGSTFVAGADISVSQDAAEDIETVRMSIRRSRLDDLDVTGDRLVIHHLNEDTDEWEALETSVVSEGESEVVVEAPSAGFSTYAAFAQAEEETVTTTTAEPTTVEPTTTTESTTEPTPTTTEPPTTEPPTGVGGFGPGAIAGLVAVILAALLALYVAYRRE